MRRGVVIVAGGSGQRMGSSLPKQYLELEGKPIILHTLERFLSFDPHIKIVVVLAEEHRMLWEAMPFTREQGIEIEVAPGGINRFDSVKNGLELIADDLVVGIHDAVRPLVSIGTLERCYASAKEHGSGIPVIELEETIREVKDNSRSVHVDRSDLRRVQTPQVFKSSWIKKAYNQNYQATFTDDASVFESKYREVCLVEGNRENIKITTPTDLQLAALLIRTME